jgi:hypothetical protein
LIIDETGTNTKMVRTRGRCRKGRRLIGKAPWGHWKTTTFVAGLRCNEISAPCVLDGAMDGQGFLTYVEMILVPSLSEGDIVVMDNLPAHKVDGVRKLIEVAKARLVYLVLSRVRGATKQTTLFAGLEPHRNGLRQAQGASTKGGGAYPRWGQNRRRPTCLLHRRNAKITSNTLDMRHSKRRTSSRARWASVLKPVMCSSCPFG